jgi:predicted dehydrogenase
MKNPSRRDFLRQASEAGLSAAAISLGRGTFTGAIPAPDPAPQEVAGEARSKPLGYAVVGIGAVAIGQVMPALAETKLSRLAGLVSGHPEKARHFARIYSVSEKNIYNYESYDQIASNPDIDVVYIALPNSMHPEYTIRGAQAGKHVLSEKPMCASVKDAEDMIATCRQAKRRLMIAYRLRYESNNVASIQLCRDKQLGALKMIDAEFGFVIGDPKQWRLNKQLAGGGSLMDIGIYCLQAARSLAGEEPVSVYAQTWSSDPVKFAQVEENIAFMLKFPGGVLASCYSSYGEDGVDRYRAAGPGGWVEMDPAYAYSGLIQRVYRNGKTTATQPTGGGQFAAEIDAFSDAINHNRDALTSGEEGLRDMKTLMACYESVETGKPVGLS